MNKVVAGISMSLDGFVTGKNVTREQQLGDGGDVLHQWLREPDRQDTELLASMRQDLGAVLMGRVSYDLAEGEGGWGDGGPAGQAPCFVLTHHPPAPETIRVPSVFTFVTTGIHSAVAQAKAAAGDKFVAVHGASAAQQCLRAGLMDEIQIHLVPVLLSGGTRLFQHLGGPVRLERIQLLESTNAIHLRMRVVDRQDRLGGEEAQRSGRGDLS